MTEEELQKNGEHWYELYKKEKTENEQLKARNDQFTKAKEIIKQLMYVSRDCIAWYCLCDKANQFLKEIENEVDSN